MWFLRGNCLNLGDGLGCLSTENFRDKVYIPGLSIGVPMISNRLGKVRPSDREIEVIMNGVPERTPRARPDTRVTLVNLNGAVLVEILLNLKNRGPENGFGVAIF